MAELDFPFGFTEDVAPTVDTYLLGSGGKVKASVLAALGVFAPGPAAVPDAGAFGTEQTLPAPGYDSGGLTDAELTTIADVAIPGGTAIRLDAVDGSAFANAIWWSDEAIEIDEIDRIEAYIEVDEPSLGDDVRAGIVWCGDPTAETGLAALVGFDATGTPGLLFTRFEPGGGAAGVAAPASGVGLMTVHVIGSRPATADPPALIYRVEFVSTDGSVATSGVHTTTSTAPWSAVWDTAECNRLGVMLISGSTGAVDPIGARVTGFRVVRRAR